MKKFFLLPLRTRQTGGPPLEAEADRFQRRFALFYFPVNDFFTWSTIIPRPIGPKLIASQLSTS